MTRPNERRRGWIVLAAAVVAAALTARLGVWQLDRAQQKIALQQAIDARSAQPPLAAEALARSVDEAAAQHHRRIRLVGQWRDAHSVWLDNRQMQGRPGFYLVTPLQLADGTAVLVQRGWAPRDALDRTRLPAVPTPAGDVEVDGRIAPPPARLYDFGAVESGRIRQNLDSDAFARETGLVLRPLSVLQLGDGVDDGLQRRWPQVAVDVHKHYGYAFQWFALCALITGLYVWFRIVQPRRRR
jgi:surfeit locus 1 family protein